MVDHAPADTNDTVLRCAGIERSFGGLKALKGVSLDVYRGEIFGLVGPNGSGKTTLVNVVTGFYPPNAGTVTLFEGHYAADAARRGAAGRRPHVSEPRPLPGNERSRQHNAWPSRPHETQRSRKFALLGLGVAGGTRKPEDRGGNH